MFVIVLTGSICSNFTDLSDLSIVGTFDVFVYTKSCDLPDWLVQYCLSSRAINMVTCHGHLKNVFKKVLACKI